MKPAKLTCNLVFRLINRTLVVNSQSRSALVGLSVMSLLLANVAARADTATAYWNNPLGGDWNNAVNWNPNAVPSTNDWASIQDGATVTVSTTPATGVLQVWVGQGTQGTFGPGPGNGTLVVTNCTFTNNSTNFTALFIVGKEDAGATASVSGTMNIVSNGLFVTEAGVIGQASGSYASTANLNVSDNGQYLADSWLDVAEGGTGTVTVQQNGQLTANGINVGRELGGVGTLTLSDNAKVTSTAPLLVGWVNASVGQVAVADNSTLTARAYVLMGLNDTSSGILDITNNGAVGDAGDLACGQGDYGQGTINMSGGQLGVGGWLMLGRQYYASGTFNQNGGAVTVTNELHIGVFQGGDGTYNLTNGTLTVLSQYALVGSYDASIGTFNQAGGLFRMPNAGGTEYVGFLVYSEGTLNLTGGTNSLGHSLYVGFSDNSVGTANLTGGTLNANTANSGGDIEVGIFTTSQGTLNIGGTAQVNLLNNGPIIIGANNTTQTNSINQNGGTVAFYADGGTNVGGTGNLVIGNYASWNGGSASGDNSYHLDGGTLIIGGSIMHTSTNGTGELYLNGGILRATADQPNFIQTNLTMVVVLTNSAVIDSDVHAINIPAPLLDGGGGGGLTKLGSGVLTLSGANNYSGSTVVSNGTLLVNGSIGSGAVTVATGATLGGNGTVNGPVTINGTLSPGASVDTLTINGNLSLAGNLFIEIDKSLAQTNDYTSVSGSLTSSGTGTVTVTNLNAGLPLAAGDTFKLFNKSVSGGGTMVITPAPGAGLTWGNRLAIDGSIVVNTGVAQNPTNITCSVSGGNLNLGWPEDHIGWTLQAQTNSLGTNWVSVPGSSSVNTESFTINPANGSVFYRLIYP